MATKVIAAMALVTVLEGKLYSTYFFKESLKSGYEKNSLFTWRCLSECSISGVCFATQIVFADSTCSLLSWTEYENLDVFQDLVYRKILPESGSISATLITTSAPSTTTIPTTASTTTTATTLPSSCLNDGSWTDGTQTSCDCVPSFTGTFCERYWDDCAEGFNLGITGEGVYRIQPRPYPYSFDVFCSMVWGGRTYVQRQKDGNANFFATWNEYRDGFGDISADFWLGLDKIKAIADAHINGLIVHLDYKSSPTWRQAIFEEFTLTDESDGYRMQFVTYKPSKAQNALDDTLTELIGAKFSTHDNDQDENISGNCAQIHQSGWWFKNCALCNPNGNLRPIPQTTSKPDDLFWDGDTRGPKKMYLALRRKNV